VPVAAPRLIRVIGVSYHATIDNTTLSGYANFNVAQFLVTNFLQATVFVSYFTSSASAQLPISTTSPATNIDFTAASFALGVRYLALFEFLDNNGVAGYQRNSTDQIVSTYDLSSASVQWLSLAVPSRPAIFDPVTGQLIEVWSCLMQTFDGVFTLRVTGSGRPLGLGAGIRNRIDSASLKLDLQIQYYNYANASSQQTSIGLFAALIGRIGAAGTAGSFDSANSSDPNNPSFAGASFRSGSTSLIHAHNTTASIFDSSSVETASSVYFDSWTDPDASQTTVAGGAWTLKVAAYSFSGVRPNTVFWDPTLNAIGMEQPDNLPPTPAPTNTAVVHCVASAMVLMCLLFVLLL